MERRYGLYYFLFICKTLYKIWYFLCIYKTFFFKNNILTSIKGATKLHFMQFFRVVIVFLGTSL